MEDVPLNQRRLESIQRRAREYFGDETEAVMTYMLFMRIAKEVYSTMNARLEELGLSEGRLFVLMMLRDAPEYSLTPSELADRCEVTRGTITGLLDNLERAGFIARKSYLGDRRMLTIQLTEQGRAFIDETLPKHFQRFKKMINTINLSEEELQHMKNILTKIKGGISVLTEP